MSSEHKFVQPGSFSRPYLTTPPSREMVGGRRQTQVFDNKLDVGAVKNLITKAKKANIIDPQAKTLYMAADSVPHISEIELVEI